MKQALRFLNEQEFQSFTSQLFGEELPSFQAIEGAGGDGGLDGIEGETAYQMFFPEPKNRTKQKYIAKIDDSLAKLQKTMTKQELALKRWIFVVPEDLQYEVVLHLRKKSAELGVECLYWGATKLTALLNKYPHIRDAFPGVFLPDVKQDLGDVKTGIAQLGRRSNGHDVEIITDEEYERQRAEIKASLERQGRSAGVQFSGSAVDAARMAYHTEANKKLADLAARKKTSDRFYELERQDIIDDFAKEYEAKQNDLGRRNMLTSGFGQQELLEIRERRTRELEKLALKYGKTKTITTS